MRCTPATSDPVMELVVERARAGSRPGRRSDGARLALAIEGGGMAGAVSAGMCAALEARGLTASFDVIYGSSAGALNASYTACGQAQRYLDLYVLAARRRVVDPRRVLFGRPAFHADRLFGLLLREHEHALEALATGPRLAVTATRIDGMTLALLEDLCTPAEVRTALQASCSIPGVTGSVVEFRGWRYVDGALSESVPYRVALRDGATHVLALRSRPAGFRQPELRGARRLTVDRLLRAAPQGVIEIYRGLPDRYNAEARELESPERVGLAGRLSQLAPPENAPVVRQLESRPYRVRAALALGARSVHDALVGVPCSPRAAPAAVAA